MCVCVCVCVLVFNTTAISRIHFSDENIQI